MATTKKVIKEDAEATTPAQASVQMKPTNKMAMMAQAINTIAAMKDEDLNGFMEMIGKIGHEADLIPDDNAAKNASTIQMKASAAMKEEVDAELTNIFGSIELTEENKSKISTLFEAAVSSKIATEIELLKEEYDEKLEDQATLIVEEMTDSVDSYLSYMAEQWMETNKLALQSELRSEITESILAGIKEVFEQHNVNIPEDKVDVVEDLALRLEHSESELNQTKHELIEAYDLLNETAKDRLLDDASKDLTVIQKSKFAKLVEHVEFDPETYSEKLEIIKENHFSNKKPVSKMITEDATLEDEVPQVKEKDPHMTAIGMALTAMKLK